MRKWTSYLVRRSEIYTYKYAAKSRKFVLSYIMEIIYRIIENHKYDWMNIKLVIHVSDLYLKICCKIKKIWLCMISLSFSPIQGDQNVQNHNMITWVSEHQSDHRRYQDLYLHRCCRIETMDWSQWWIKMYKFEESDFATGPEFGGKLRALDNGKNISRCLGAHIGESRATSNYQELEQ